MSRHSRNLWTLTFRGSVDRLREILRTDPSRARAVATDGTTPLWWLPDDEDTAIEIARQLIEHGADPGAYRAPPDKGTRARPMGLSVVRAVFSSKHDV